MVLLLVLGSHTGSIHRTGASEEVVLARCNNCSSNLCLLFSPFEPRFLQQIRLHKNHNCGTVASYHGSKWSSTELVHCRKVKLRSCTSFPQAIQVWVGEDQVFLIVDLTFHGQWHILLQWDAGHHAVVVLLFFGSHTSLANSHGRECWSCTGKVRQYVLPSCACYLAHLSWDLYDSADLGRVGCARIKNCGTVASYHGSKWS